MTDEAEIEEQFQEAAQQHEAAMMGMYIFLGTEIMLFGGIMTVALGYRFLHPQEIVAASKKLHLWIAAGNTAILLTSSLLVALAVHAARHALRDRAAVLLAGAALLGCAFLGLKGYEYWKEYTNGLLPHISDPTEFSSRVEQLFMNIYLAATSLHAFHLAVGILIMLGLIWRLTTNSMRLPGRAVTVEVAGLYWHLVDIVWIFLFPVLYLAR